MEKEFEKFRNYTPYKVPDGFFGNITKLTIEKARLRKRNIRVRNMLVTFSVAASIIILVAVGSLFLNQTPKGNETDFAQPLTEEMVFEEIQPEDIFKTDPVENSEVEIMEEEQAENVPEDLLANLIAGLSDEDLRQLEAFIKEELLITEFLNY